ncbi:peptide/nickel transport system permease protein [Lachnospiraceae bacterium XPB1003]|nr:peptide/nickel transport system permease protein [Lachnospiraceae bacterium XPB1003]
MKKHVFKKLITKIISALVIVFGVTFLTFLLSYLSPDDAAVVKLSSMGTGYTQEMLEETREEMGLNRSFLEQYLDWMKNVCRLDFGRSYRTGEDITDMMLAALPNTLVLAFLSLLITLVISLPIGIMCAYHPDGVLDSLMRVYSYFFSSVPSFFISLIVLYYACIQWKLFKVMAEPGIRGFILPALVTGVTLSSWYIRQIRAIALEQLCSPYVYSLYSRGISRSRILWKHVLKNCMVPVITLLGISVGGLLGGSAITESIFSVKGVGALAVSAVTSRDYPFIQAYAAWMAALYLLVNSVVDIIGRKLDPRIS